MPITSAQMSGMIGGQQAMFGNFASYAQQISPTGAQGPTPTYQNPMQGAGEAFAPPPLASNMGMQMGPQAISAAGNIGLPAIASGAMLAGSMMPGRAGRFMGGLDPMTQGMRGFAQGSGWMRGAGMGANMSRFGAMGGGGMLRAGLAGIGGAAARMMPALGLAQAASYGVGQMTQGAQFQNQVGGFLQNQFRHTNPQSRTGFGFDRGQQGQISEMVRTMGHEDMMTGPQELLRVMKGGAQMGMFRAVQDVKEFKKRFTDMVGSLKEVAKTMNTTLEGAMPFFQQSRQMGFWTPQDISRHAQQARSTAAATGMSSAQVQQQMGMGTQMARGVGAMGYQGAQGMAQSMQVVGGGLRSGVIGERQMTEAFGTTNMQDATAQFAGQMQRGATRFASSRRGRWVMAALGQNNFQSLNAGKMQDFSSGMMSLGEIGGQARRNIGRQGAYNFKLNERQLRGQLLERGPEAQAGFVRMLAGKSLYGKDPRSRLITQRLIARTFGMRGQQGKMMAELARNLPQIMEANKARSATLTDQIERNQEQLQGRSWEGVKRKISSWWDREVKDPLQKIGAETSRDMADFWDKAGDKLWGTTAARHKLRGISRTGMQAMQKAAMGDTRSMEQAFGKAGDFQKEFGQMGGDVGGEGMAGGLVGGMAKGVADFSRGGIGGMISGLGGGSSASIDTLRRMGVKERGFQTEEGMREGMREEGLVRGRTTGVFGGSDRYKAFRREDVEKARQGLYAASTGRITARTAAALGFSSEKDAKSSIETVQKEMEDSAYKLAAGRIADQENLSGRDLAEAQVKAITAGKLGGVALQKFIKGGRDMATKVHRLAAAQTGQQRRRVGGIDLSDEARDLGMDAFTSGDVEKRLGERMEESEESLAATLTASLYGTGKGGTGAAAAEGRWALPWQTSKRQAGMGVVTPEVIEKVQKKGGEKFKRAMMLMASGESAEERASNAAKAKDLLADLATDEKFTAAERQALQAMTDDKSPVAPLIKAAMRDMGKTHKQKARAEFTATVMRRSQRMMKNMGVKGEEILETMEKITGKGGGPDMGRMVRQLMDEQDPEQYVNKMRALVNLSGQADEGQVADAAEMLKGVEGAEHIVIALQRGRQIGQQVRALTGKDREKATVAANLLTGGVTELGTKDVKILTSGSAKQKQDFIDKRVEEIKKREGEDRANIARDMLTALGSGDPTTITNKARQVATARSVAVLGDPKKSILHSQIRQMKAGDVQGQLGSRTGMHTEMIKQTLLMQRIAEATEGDKPATGAPAEKPKSVTGATV